MKTNNFCDFLLLAVKHSDASRTMQLHGNCTTVCLLNFFYSFIIAISSVQHPLHVNCTFLCTISVVKICYRKQKRLSQPFLTSPPVLVFAVKLTWWSAQLSPEKMITSFIQEHRRFRGMQAAKWQSVLPLNSPNKLTNEFCFCQHAECVLNGVFAVC